MTILHDIVRYKKAYLSRRKKKYPLSYWQDLVEQSDQQPLNFAAALKSRRGSIRLIAEVKKASPSAGIIKKI